MYNAKAVIVGAVIFAVLFSSPFWLNFGKDDYKRPDVKGMRRACGIHARRAHGPAQPVAR